jgi:hypothetical protein
MDRQKMDEEIREVLDRVRQKIVTEASGSLQSMAQMEELIYGELNRSKPQLLQAWINQAQDDSARPVCPHCGRRMRQKQRVPKTCICDSGQVEIRRTRWWCDACKASFFPSGPNGDGGGLSDHAQGGGGRH